MSEQNANPVELFGMRVAHVGINATDPADALEIAELFSTMMGLPVIETPVSYFNDSLVEVISRMVVAPRATSALPSTTLMRPRSGLPSAGSRSTKSRARCCPTVAPSSCTLSASSPVSPCICAASSAQAAIASKKG
ncbi:MAG: hypothetical protein ACLTHL_01315 [Collinsella sp.]